ncbi:uncharacterized protein L201_007070 [Kwoniella dendrophila CBS 6074]|uniref:Uncharacterized protein n=1 Tax=Kwoniella dendrophila CBS 6074 TaxID=1295534 RepID=A0AAX4K2X6_9TREE
MPKHLPTFKHLLNSSTTITQKQEPKEKSVNDLINSSRNSRPSQSSSTSTNNTRGVPSYLIHNGTSNTNPRERIWSPSPIASGSGTSNIGSLVEIEQGGIHPAEILRRSNLEYRQVSRSVAGPAPPPSWRPSSLSSQSINSSSSLKSYGRLKKSIKNQIVTTKQLEASSDLFTTTFNSASIKSGTQNGIGVSTLVEYCFKTVLRYLEDEEIIYASNLDENGISEIDEMNHQAGSEEIYTLGELLREQIPYLSTHMKSSLLNTASLLPSSSNHRLSDQSFLSILSDPPPPDSHPYLDNVDDLAKDNQSEESLDGDWDNPITSEPIISHIPITIHFSPQTVLNRIQSLNSIISLNLSYSTLPLDLDKLVSVLPAGLRELSLVGIHINSSSKVKNGLDDVELSQRGFGGLARKLIVLRMLDLSLPNFDLTPKILEGLLVPGNVKLPSLRILGLRGYPVLRIAEEEAEANGYHIDGIDSAEDCFKSDNNDINSQNVVKEQKIVVDLLKNGGRNKYVEVVW